MLQQHNAEQVLESASDEEEEVKGDIEGAKVAKEATMEELQKGSQQSWDKFYKHNQDKFFKNRNYLTFAFERIESKISEAKEKG